MTPTRFYELRPNLRNWETATPDSSGYEYYNCGHILDHDKKLAIAILPKVACTSVVLTAMKHLVPDAHAEVIDRLQSVPVRDRFRVVHRVAGTRGLYDEDPPEDYARVSLIRHPVERLMSAWRGQCDGDDVGTLLPHGKSFTQFLIWLSYQSPFAVDKHVRPYSLCLHIDTELYPIECALPHFLERVGWSELEHVNKSSTPAPALNPHLEAMITRLYTQDTETWLRLADHFREEV